MAAGSQSPQQSYEPSNCFSNYCVVCRRAAAIEPECNLGLLSSLLPNLPRGTCAAVLKLCEPDQQVELNKASQMPDDPLNPQQWALKAIDMEGAWNKSAFGSSGVRVCMVDTGCPPPPSPPGFPISVLCVHDNTCEKIFDPYVHVTGLALSCRALLCSAKYGQLTELDSPVVEEKHFFK